MKDVWTKKGEFLRTIWNISDWIKVFDGVVSDDMIKDILDQYLETPILYNVGGRKKRTKVSLISEDGYQKLISKYYSLNTMEVYQFVK
jgi:hypothetical protein